MKILGLQYNNNNMESGVRPTKCGYACGNTHSVDWLSVV